MSPTRATFLFGKVFSRRTPRILFHGISGNIDTSSIGVSLTASYAATPFQDGGAKRLKSGCSMPTGSSITRANKCPEEWLQVADWRASLLILDEAHHAKNDNTRLGRLLRSEDATELGDTNESEEKIPLFRDKFDRMLFLTATPFQLGHREIIRVLRSFGSAKWTGEFTPAFSRGEFGAALTELETRLDANRIAARRLDSLWGRLQPDHAMMTGTTDTALGPSDQWWDSVHRSTGRSFRRGPGPIR